MASEYSRMDWGAGNVRRLPFTGFQGKYPYRSRDRDDRFIGPMAPDYFTNDFYRGGLEGNFTNLTSYRPGRKGYERDNFIDYRLRDLQTPFDDLDDLFKMNIMGDKRYPGREKAWEPLNFSNANTIWNV